MNLSEIKALQRYIGVEPDGFWGPVSTAECKKYLRSLMPSVNPWPKQDQSSLQSFYGSPGDESRLVNLDVRDLCIMYDDALVKTIRCNEKVADSLKRVLKAINSSEWQYILSDYAGCYNNRTMRQGTLPSLHARGAAIDLRPLTNGNRAHWPIASDMPIQVMEMFAVEGWTPAGAFWSRDAMHMQATQP